MESEKRHYGKELVAHFQTGVSYMIPLVVASGLLASLAVIFGGNKVWNETSDVWGVMSMIGQTGLHFIVPMIAAFIAYSIADRPGLAPAFILGLVAYTMGTGFLGGMFVGIAVGYLALFLKSRIHLPANLASMNSMLIIPLITTLVVGLVLWYVVGGPIHALTDGITGFLNSMSGTNLALLSAILGAGMAFDMGGPVNKTVLAFGLAAYSQGQYHIVAAVWGAIAIPNTVMFIATLIGRKLYQEEDKENARAAIIMGITGITEGTIPFAVKDPIRVIPSIMVGSAIGAGLMGLFGISNPTQMATYFAIPFVSNIPLYCLSILIGGVVGALMVNFLKSFKYRKEQKEIK